MGGNDHPFFIFFRGIQRIHADGLGGKGFCQDFGAADNDGLIAGSRYGNGKFRIWLHFAFGVKAVGYVGSGKLNGIGQTGFIGGKLL